MKTCTTSEAEEEQNEQREKKDHYGARSDSSHLICTEIEFLWAGRKQETRPDQNRAESQHLALATDEQDQNLVGALSRWRNPPGRALKC
jgi:hypothetical protein